ncbi:hypothetical protein [Tardiphaga sp. 619_E2_N8_5]|uniref:hypothetical protein n=1 Tax=unclassified Tardiphaga TaxID=2631404 RepID=UPI003F1FC0A3
MRLVPLGEVHGSTALISGFVSLFFAEITAPGVSPLQEGISGYRLVEVAELGAMINRNEIADSFTLAPVLKARLAGLI